MWSNKHKKGFTQPPFLRRTMAILKSPIKMGAGFTIIELMAVVLVVSIGMLGVMNLIARVFLYSRLNQEKLIASLLAQEGIEIVRNIRDTNWTSEAASWDIGLDSDGDYGVDYLTAGLPDTPRCNSDAYLKFDGNFYTCSGIADTNTKFKRKITIQKGADEIQIKVLVTWDGYEVKAIEKIYNWNQ